MSEVERNENKEYIQARTPDKMRLAQYVNRAKGPDRTMAEFADSCGVSASTLSRIVNCKITKPVAEELIRAIVKNADPEQQIDLDLVMSANGMVPKDFHERRTQNMYNHWERRDAQISLETDMKNIISEELFSRQKMLLFYQRIPSELLPENKYRLRRANSFGIHIWGYEPKVWHIIAAPYSMEIVDERDRRMLMMRLMERYSGWFLHDAWEPEALKDIKTSFAFADMEIYQEFRELIKDVKVNSYMSIILIDPEKREVTEEYQLPRNDGKEFTSIFSEPKVVTADDEYWDDTHSEDDE